MVSAKAKKIFTRIYSMAGTGYYYTLRRNKTDAKFKLVKYDPRVGTHVLFSEDKVASMPKFIPGHFFSHPGHSKASEHGNVDSSSSSESN